MVLDLIFSWGHFNSNKVYGPSTETLIYFTIGATTLIIILLSFLWRECNRRRASEARNQANCQTRLAIEPSNETIRHNEEKQSVAKIQPSCPTRLAIEPSNETIRQNEGPQLQMMPVYVIRRVITDDFARMQRQYN